MEKLKSTVLIVLVLLTSVSMFQTLQNKANADIPFVMPSKSFVLEVLESNSTIVDYQGTKYINLSMAYGSHPMGIVYYPNKNVVYVALYPGYCNPEVVYGIAEINITSKDLKIYRFPWKIDDNFKGPMPWTIAIDDYSNLWISIRSYLISPYHPPETKPYLAKLETETANLTMYYIPFGAGSDIKYYNGYIWYMTNNGLSKISLEGVIEEFYPRYFAGGFMETDVDSIWITSATEGFVTRFNITSKCFDVNITGLDRPLGIEIDDSFIYVAENSESVGKNGTIAVISKVNFSILWREKTAIISSTGPYYVLKDNYGNLWWTDNSKHFGFIDKTDKQNIFNAIDIYCYFMTETPNTIWFSVKGSAYVGLITISNAGAGGSSLEKCFESGETL